MSYRDRERDWDEVSYPSSRGGPSVKRYPLTDDRSYAGSERQLAPRRAQEDLDSRRYDYDYTRGADYDCECYWFPLIDSKKVSSPFEY